MNPTTGAPPEQFLPLSLSVFHILLSLCDQERHGYGIMKEVRARTDGEVRLAPGPSVWKPETFDRPGAHREIGRASRC